MKSRILGLAASIVCLTTWQASAQSLSIGDVAPPIEVSRFAKGEKITKLEKDQTYVVEFWATWCGPCKTSIPHLTALQKKYKDKGIKFIGVSVWEQDQKAVDPFVKEMGDEMDYSVALDEIPKGEDGNGGKMAKSWMMASGSQGIPTAFLVKDGKITWIGHPMKLDKPLAKVVAPDYDFAKAVSEAREEAVKEKAKESKLQSLGMKLNKLGNNATPQQVLEIFTKAIDETPELEEMLGYQKYLLMVQTGDKTAAAYGMKLVDGPLKDEAEGLNAIAWMNLDPESKLAEDQRDPKFALKAAFRANELTNGENGAILDTLALAYFKTGDPAKALAAQEKAVKLKPDGDGADEMKARLKQYQKAVADKTKP